MSHTTTPEAGPVETLHYLTLQDMIWINQQVTKGVHTFDYNRLEEAVFYQYAYGRSLDVLKQAGLFVSGFMKQKPFTNGNIATAFVGCMAFLLLNGSSLNLDDSQAANWMEGIANSQGLGEKQVRELAKPDHAVHTDSIDNVEEAVRVVLERYPTAVAALAAKS